MQTLYDTWLELARGLEAEGVSATDIELTRVGFYLGAQAIRILESNAVRATNTGLISEEEADDAFDFWGAEADAENCDTDLEIH